MARLFLFATEGGEAVDCEIDAETAGTFKISERRTAAATGDAAQTVEHIGHYIELIRPTRLVFSFSGPGFLSEETVLAIDLTPLSTGGCDVILTHSLGCSAAARRAELQTEKAWQGRLELLDGVLATLKAATPLGAPGSAADRATLQQWLGGQICKFRAFSWAGALSAVFHCYAINSK